MSLRLDPANPDLMSLHERRDEIASLLARGILRLHRSVVGDLEDLQILAEDAPTCLDLPPGPRPDRPTVNGSEMLRARKER